MTRRDGFARGTEEDLARLAQVLEAEADAYGEMIALSASERGHLVARDLEALRDGVARKEALIARIDALEAERRQAVADVTARLTGAARAMTVSEILAHVRGPERARLAALRERILAEIARLERVNETNAYLIGASLDLVGQELALLSGGDEVAYDDRGDVGARRARTPLLDRKA